MPLFCYTLYTCTYLKEHHIQAQQHRKVCMSLRELLTLGQAGTHTAGPGPLDGIINETNSSLPGSIHFFFVDMNKKYLDYHSHMLSQI